MQDLQEQVRDLMVYIEAGQMVQSGDNEMAGGSVQVAPAPERTPKRNGKKGKL